MGEGVALKTGGYESTLRFPWLLMLRTNLVFITIV